MIDTRTKLKDELKQITQQAKDSQPQARANEIIKEAKAICKLAFRWYVPPLYALAMN